MALSMAPLLVWSVLATFSILVVLQLERRSVYNWFPIMTPLWISDVCLLTHAMVVRMQKFFNRYSLPVRSFSQRTGYLAVIFLKIAFEVLLCIRLQYNRTLSMFIVLAPFWVLMFTGLFNLSVRLVAQYRYYVP